MGKRTFSFIGKSALLQGWRSLVARWQWKRRKVEPVANTAVEEAPPSLVEEIEPPSQSKRKLFSRTPKVKKGHFNPATYRSLSRSNKIPVWMTAMAIGGSVLLVLVYRDVAHQREKQAFIAMYQDKLPQLTSQIANTDQQIATLNKALTENQDRLNSVKTQFYHPKIIEGSIDDITRLFEVSHLAITKQDIRFQSTPGFIEASPVAAVKPEEAPSVFSAPAPVPLDASKTPAPPAPPATPAPPKQPPPTSVAELSFLVIQLHMQGKYSNYILAREALTRIIPSVSIPAEEIFVAMGKSEVEIRVMFNIPFINQK